ncbi:MAG: AI-2E family transporter [Candidatus Gracilibacteria bacterium]|nr:AI-2E family transporter [Candidatus Gracilibacteria bacterium]
METTTSVSPLRIFSQKILILLVFAGSIYTLSLLSSVLVIVFFSGFLTILFSSPLTAMNKKKIPDWLGIIFIFLGILLFFFIALFAIIPIFIEQIAILFSYVGDSFNTWETLYKSGGVNALGFPSFLKSYIQTVDFGTLFEWMRSNVSTISSVMASVSNNLLQSSTSLISSLSGGIFQGIMIIVFTFFMTLERHSIKDFLYRTLPKDITKYLLSREDSFLQVLSSWIKGQLILCTSIFALTLLGLWSLRIFGIQVENIFTLALIAGLMEFIPYIGPFLALLPALAIVASMGITPIIAIIVLYTIIQQAENNILVPMIMSKTLDLSPFLILLMMTAMASIFGITGILLAIPFTAILQIIIGDILSKDKEKGVGGKLAKKKKP